MTHKVVNPTRVRLSKHFMLSDFMGCDSVYRHGYANRLDDSDRGRMQEGKLLATYMDTIFEEYGPLSITYGHISSNLSHRIVHYQDPDKPSYHRWDLGAACDFIPHQYLSDVNGSPIGWVADYVGMYGLDFSRIITYAESDVICFAVSALEKQKVTGMLHKVYENRYTGSRRPHYIRYSTSISQKELRKRLLEADKAVDGAWRGKGYPSYHGGGREQYEHMRLGGKSRVSDFLYSPERVFAGKNNRPPDDVVTLENWQAAGQYNAKVQEVLFDMGAYRASIVRAYDRQSRPWGGNSFVVDYRISSTAYRDESYKDLRQVLLSCARNCGIDANVVKVSLGDDHLEYVLRVRGNV